MLVTTNLFSQQTCACCNKYLSQENFCCDKKLTFVATKDTFCHDKHKHMFVMTKLLLLQKLYIWQLPPMIGSSLPVVVCGWVNRTDIKYLVLLVHIKDDKWVLTFPAWIMQCDSWSPPLVCDSFRHPGQQPSFLNPWIWWSSLYVNDSLRHPGQHPHS